jgi:hypothetical protein
MDDHDQRFKELLRNFFPEFVRLFFPEWAERLDLGRVQFLNQEMHLDPPQGERRLLDLVAQVPTRAALPDPGGRPGEFWYVVVSTEVESPDRVAPFRPRMLSYYQLLRQKHRMPVWPIGLFLRVGLDGVGWDVYEERLWGRTLLRFEYAYVGLPALDGAAYAAGENLLGVALAALMRLPGERRAELKLTALNRIARSGEDSARKYMLAECLQAYLRLTEAEQAKYQRLEQLEAGREVREMTTGWIEQGIEQGRERERRELLQKLLTRKFGLLSETARARVQQLSMDQMEEMLEALLDATSLRDLGLED